MSDLDTQDHSAPREERAAQARGGLLAFIADLFQAFTTVDPRVITRQERRNGRTALGF